MVKFCQSYFSITNFHFSAQVSKQKWYQNKIIIPCTSLIQTSISRALKATQSKCSISVRESEQGEKQKTQFHHHDNETKWNNMTWHKDYVWCALCVDGVQNDMLMKWHKIKWNKKRKLREKMSIFDETSNKCEHKNTERSRGEMFMAFVTPSGAVMK